MTTKHYGSDRRLWFIIDGTDNFGKIFDQWCLCCMAKNHFPMQESSALKDSLRLLCSGKRDHVTVVSCIHQNPPPKDVSAGPVNRQVSSWCHGVMKFTGNGSYQHSWCRKALTGWSNLGWPTMRSTRNFIKVKLLSNTDGCACGENSDDHRTGLMVSRLVCSPRWWL